MTATPQLSNSAIAIARDDLERILQVLTAVQESSGLAASIIIDRLNEVDGDPDVELNGDERDGTAAEDDFYPHSNWRGEPGCPVSDPGGAAEGEDDEDDDPREVDDEPEEDDPSGQCDEDGINTHDMWLQMPGRFGAGCPISDPGGDEHDGREQDDGI